MNAYRRAVWRLFKPLLAGLGPVPRVLDFGSGDGWFAQEMRKRLPGVELLPLDVQRRARELVEPVLYDGSRIPFADRSFDLAYSVDVLHHCPDPRASLREVLRCTGRYFLLKDHTYRGPLGKAALCLLDEVGNRRFGVPSPHHYQRRWEWLPWIEEAGFRRRALIRPAPCHRGVLGWLTNHLQLVGLWERT
jgi:SAM-dependent methyltransferase